MPVIESFEHWPLGAEVQGAILAGMIANRIFYAGSELLDFKPEVALVLAVLLCLVFGPLLVFAPQLAQAKRKGNREYGTLAQRYVRDFDAKWLRGGAPADERLVGSGDIQSLADLGNSFEVIRNMRLVPVALYQVILLPIGAAVPILPLFLTVFPPDELVLRSVKSLVGM